MNTVTSPLSVYPPSYTPPIFDVASSVPIARSYLGWQSSSVNNSPLSAGTSQMYSNVNHSPIADFNSPSSPSNFLNDFDAGHRSPSVQNANVNDLFGGDIPPQIHSSVGPVRGKQTRRNSRQEQTSRHLMSRPRNNELQARSTMYLMPPQSNPFGHQPSSHVNEPAYPSSMAMNMMQAQQNFQLASTSSQDQLYDNWSPMQGHSRSTSASDIAREVSPTPSNVSALTSLSSDNSQSQNFPPHMSHSAMGQNNSQRFRKTRLYNGDRKRMCELAAKHPDWKQQELAKQFNVERSTVSKILKNRKKWLTIVDADVNRVAKHRPSKFPEIEDVLAAQLRTVSQNPGPAGNISDLMIRKRAMSIARSLNISEDKFKGSAGWVDNFKCRWGIKKNVFVVDEATALPAPNCEAGPSTLFSRGPCGYDEEVEVDTGLESEDSPTAPLQPSTWTGALYQPKLGEGGVTTEDAEGALSTLLAFVDAQGEGWVTTAERNALQHVKCLLVQTSQGLPYERSY